MPESNKTISFVMPCFNDGASVEKGVRSIRDQDLPDIEMIVINDGSTDSSKVVLDALKEQGLIDTLIHFETNKGACEARNTGAKEAHGKYLSFLPADAVLYPGMARIWYNTLEENPDYDFAYGGYRIVDDAGTPIPGYDLFFQPFEPHLLEVSNYIDGSFPIRTESYWKYAKIMNQPDGLWDSNIKSLQDWDFWLSVVKNGGKGIYIQDIFFETTMPHKGGLSDDSSQHWLERLDQIKAKHHIPIRRLCVASLGAAFHGKRLSYLLDADFQQMPSAKPHRYDAIYVIGFYPELAARQGQMFWNNANNQAEGITPAKKIVHFIGTDVWQLYHCSMISLKFWKEYFKNNVDVVLCESDFIQNELKELGIEAEVVPLPPLKLNDIKPLPEKFTVACYSPYINGEFYRPNDMYEIAKQLPDVQFKFFGNPLKKGGTDPALPPNIDFMGFIEDMEKFIESCSAIMRFPIHDGLPISVIEFILMGRYSVQNVPLTHTFYLQNFKVEDAVDAIKALRQKTIDEGVNQKGSDYWREVMSHEKYRQTIKKYAEYDPKQYWEKRALSWSEQAKAMSVEQEEVKTAFEKAKKLLKIENPSVLDIGCGDGRWYPIIKEWGIGDYYGIDISENLIKAAQFRFPAIKENFSSLKLEALDREKPFAYSDIVFSYTCLEHIKEEDMPKAANAIKKNGRIFILVEPTDFVSRYYCFSHDYRKYFNVVEEIPLSNKTVFICSN